MYPTPYRLRMGGRNGNTFVLVWHLLYGLGKACTESLIYPLEEACSWQWFSKSLAIAYAN